MESYLEIVGPNDTTQISRMTGDIERFLNGNLYEAAVVCDRLWVGIKVKKLIGKHLRRRVEMFSPRQFKDAALECYNRAYYLNFDTYKEQSIPVFTNGYYTTKLSNTLTPSELTAGTSMLSRVLYLRDFYYTDMTRGMGEVRRVYETDSLNTGYIQQKADVLRDYLITPVNE